MKEQEQTGGKREPRVVFSEVQAFEKLKTGAAVFVVVVLVFINRWQDRSCPSYLVPLPAAHSMLRWTRERCEPLPDCRQLPALQHPRLPPTTRQAEAGRGTGGAQAVKQGHGQRAGNRWVEDVFPTPDVFRDPAALVWHNMGQSSTAGEGDQWRNQPSSLRHGLGTHPGSWLLSACRHLPEVPHCPPGKERHKQNNTTHLPNLHLESVASIKCNYLILNQGQLLLHVFAVPSGFSERELLHEGRR